MNVWDWLRFIGGILALVAAALLLLRLHGVSLRWLPATAVFRAGLQLAVISVLLSGVNQWPWLVLGFVALMLATASWTGASRAEGLPGGRRYAVVSVIAGGMSALLLTLLLGLISPTPQHVVAIAGSVIGNAMNIVTLTSRRIRTELDAHRGEVEGWLALGATPSQATAWLRRDSVRESLLPNLDQTRNTGLVTLPGAFIGALFGGASPVEAATFQLTMLSAILVSASVTGTLFSTLSGRNPVLPAPPEA
ncbi:MAG: ABC transporter permease [Propionibacterium sp.]|nr:ABC transporter permease [Propionibacterium sp.]